MSRPTFFLTIALLGLSVAATGCEVDKELKTPVYKTGIKADETRASAFKEQFPIQYASFQKNNETTVMTEYKGSVPFHKHDNVNPLPKGYKHAQPYLKNLWLGYPFMYEYNEARGHTYAVEDFVNIDRINRYDEKGGLPATCWNCKTPVLPLKWHKEEGDAFWSKDVNQYRGTFDMKDESISCVTCHNPETMALQITSIPLNDWLVRSGKDVNKISRNEMRSLVCAQCHVEYYFTHKDNGPAAKPVFPWDKGFGPENMAEYYKEHGPKDASGKSTPFADWTHAASKIPMVKMQHPEYETWIDGTHGAAGVSCADCHMAYERTDGKKVSGHWWTSPLKDPKLTACRQCHADKSPEFLRERVLYTQDKTFRQLLVAQEFSVKAHEAVRLANAHSGDKAPNFDALMAEAREMVRKGQIYWDYVSAENSIGFHNPTKALDTLAESTNLSRSAIDKVNEATLNSYAAVLSKPAADVVTPILEHSRKLQQDPAHLASNPWLQLLPLLPKADQVWDGDKKIK